MGTQNNLLMSYNFRVTVPGGEFRVSKVRSIEQAVELEPVREGGCNDYVHMLVKPASEPKKLILERGLCTRADALGVASLLGKRQTQPMIVAIYDRANQKILKKYQAEGWMLCKWQLSDLDAVSGGLLLETAEVVYETLKEL